MEPNTAAADAAASERRANIIQLNNDIASHASKKQLNEAVAIFEDAKANDLINSHTYAATLNAYIRCGDMVGARALFEEIKQSSRFKLDVITFTTMMKGYCSQGDMKQATELLEYMPHSKPPIVPNIRTINTYLRGCIVTGSVSKAVDAYDRMRNVYKIAPDVSTYESVVALFSQGLQLEKAMPVVGRLRDDASCKNGLSLMYFYLGRAAAVLADWKLMRRSFASSKEFIHHINDDVDNSISSSHSADQASNKHSVGGGKRSWKSSMDESRLESLQMFREHKIQELCREIEIISEYGERKCSKGENIPRVQPFYRLLTFSCSKEESEDDQTIREQLADEILENLCEKFGVLSILNKLYPEQASKPLSQLIPKAQGTAKPANSKYKGKKKDKRVPEQPRCIDVVRGIPVLQHLKQHVSDCFGSDGFIVFDNLFREYSSYAVESSSSASSEEVSHVDVSLTAVSVSATTSKPIYAEICSGAGEWVVSQARANADVNWLSFELRTDRVYQTFVRSICEDANNLAVIGGDVMKILPNRILNNSLTIVCVNHPEPPQQNAEVLASQAKHLLDEEFMLEMQRVLKVHGMVTILTDNSWYSKFLAQSIAASATLVTTSGDQFSGGQLCAVTMEMAAALNIVGSSDWRVYSEENSAVPVFEGKPGPDCGHFIEASSYFDRMWKRNDLNDRYFIVVRKIRCSSEDVEEVYRPFIRRPETHATNQRSHHSKASNAKRALDNPDNSDVVRGNKKRFDRDQKSHRIRGVNSSSIQSVAVKQNKKIKFEDTEA